MKKVLRKFDTPTTVFIIGDDVKDVTQTVSLNDDYQSVEISGNSDTTVYMDTIGSLFVLTLKEMVAYHKAGLFEEDADQGVALFEDFVGEITIDIVDDKGVSVLNEDFGPLDNIMYETSTDLGELDDWTIKVHADGACEGFVSTFEELHWGVMYKDAV